MRDWRASIEAIIELERGDAPQTMEERVAELADACRSAASMMRALDRSISDAPKRPWPESTMKFLREQTAAINGE